MPNLNFERTRELLQQFNFKKLFVEELGWNNPRNKQPTAFACEGASFTRTAIADLGDVPVYEILAQDGRIPDAKLRRAVHKAIPEAENLLVFVTKERRDSLWYWIKREGSKTFPREHYYAASQPGDLFLGKLSAMLVDISELEQAGGQLSVVEVLGRLRAALDIEHVTKKFYAHYQTLHVKFLDYIEGIEDERDRRWYTSVILNRLMFVYFLQRKEFLPERDLLYLQNKLAESKKRGKDRFYGEFLRALFFEAFAKPEDQRDEAARQMVGDVKYLDGGLFLEHPVERRWPQIAIPDKAFDELLELFQGFSWNLDDTPGGKDDEINPDVLGYIFEKYINQKAFGAFYTRTEITEHLCERTIERVILDRINSPLPLAGEGLGVGAVRPRHFNTLPELLMSLDAGLCRELLFDVLPKLSLLDPACGSGAFLVAAMKTLIGIYTKVIGQIDFEKDKNLRDWKAGVLKQHPSLSYYVKKTIITDNLFGVDIMEEAVEIARLRLFLALVASARTVDDLEPLPNIDFNLLAGNSLIGLLRVDEAEYNRRPKKFDVMQGSYHQVVEEKRRKLETYRHTTTYSSGLASLRDEIQALRESAHATLNDILLDDFNALGAKFEQATWDAKKKAEGKPTKRAVQLADIHEQKPFHWGYEFDEVMNAPEYGGRGGFDAIITNPPWEILKPNAKEFFAEYSDLVTKKNMTIEEFEKEQAHLLQERDVRAAWLEYQSRFPHVSAYYRAAPQYANQIAIVNGRKAGSDINLYKLFLEQCFNLLRPDGRCGIIVPSGIYTDLGAKQLREMLFTQAEVSTLFGLSNERYIFEGVHHAFKICLLVFKKGGQTESFTAAFRINPREAIAPDQLESFLHNPNEHVQMSVPLARRLSPDSLSVMEFKDEADVQIAEKMLRWPMLGKQLEGTWKLSLTAEFHMTNDSYLFKSKPGAGRLPLFEGKMIHQFDHRFGEPRYWVNEKEGRATLIGRGEDTGQKLDYQGYRLGLRAVAASTNERSMVCTIIPADVFCGNSVLSSLGRFRHDAERLFCTATLNSFVIDWMLRIKVTTNINMFYVYQLPVPRLTGKDARFKPIVDRAARLICTTPEFDDLAKQVGLVSHKRGVTDPAARAKLRAELDGMVAHLYGLTEAEFAHILGTFPLVEQSVKDTVIQAYRAFALSPEDEEVRAMIEAGENEQVEFKVAGRVNPHTKKSDASLKDDVLRGVAAFLNSKGGNVLVGVHDDQTIVGLADDYADIKGKKADRDKYEQFLRNVFGNELGHDLAPNIAISFHTLEGKDVCRVAVKPASKPVYLNGDLYMRAGNTTRKLSAQGAVAYIPQQWP